MRKSVIVLLAALPLASAVLAETTMSTGVVDVRASMTDEINPAIMGVWDISNAAMSDTGGIDPALMNDKSWQDLADAARQLAAASMTLAGSEMLLSAAPDNVPEGDGQNGLPAMEDIQHYINADPVSFREKAQALADVASALAVAAQSYDAEKAGPLVEELNLACENCHSQFWYPPQD